MSAESTQVVLHDTGGRRRQCTRPNEMLTVFVNVYFGIPAMLSNFQMLCISCLTDVAVSIALVSEKPETNIMYRPPRRANERLVNLKLLLYAYLVPGIITFVGCTNSYFWYSHEMGIPPGGQWLAFNGVTGTYPASNHSTRVTPSTSTAQHSITRSNHS